MKKFLKGILIFSYKFFVRTDFYLGSAIILSLLTKPVIRNNGKIRVLSLSKPVFSLDLNEIASKTQKICFLSFPRLLLSEYVKKHVSHFDNLNDGSYHKNLSKKEKDLIYNSIDKLFSYLLKTLRFDAVFAGNYVYVSQQEFFRVCLNKGIPVIVLYKEGMRATVNNFQEISPETYANKIFNGNKILFYNHHIKEMLLTANVPGITEDKTAVVGIPRLDSYFASKRKIAKKHITLFFFDPKIRAELYAGDPNNKEAYIERSESFISNFILFCTKHQNYDLIIKTKDNQSSFQRLSEILNKYKINALPDNVTLSSTESAMHLIQNSSFVASSMSTTLLEAMVASKPIICPYFKDIVTKKKVDFFEDYPDAVNYIKLYSELEDLLSGSSKPNLPGESLKKTILEPLIYKVDGNSSERVIYEILKITDKA